MPYTTFLDLTFNPADYAGADTAAKQAAVHAAARKLYGFYQGGSAVDTLSPTSENTLAHPEVVFDGANSHVKAVVAPAASVIEVAGAFSLKSDMDADLDAAAGQLVNCFDPDGTKRGRYEKVGGTGTGSWSRVGDVSDWLWPDPNHPGKLLNLLPFGSWINSSPPFPLRGDQAIYPAPPSDDWRRVRLTFTVRGIDVEKDPLCKLVLHCQGNVEARTAALPQESVAGNYFVPNFIKTGGTLLSDALGFNEPGSWGTPDVRLRVEDSGWVDWVVDFSIKDEDWQCLGGIDRTLASSPYYYGACPIEELLTKLTGNIYWLAVYEKPRTDPDGQFTPVPATELRDAERLRGTIMVKRIKAEYYTA